MFEKYYIYKLFQKKSPELPIKSQQFIKYMTEYDLLFNYQFKEGIEKVLQGMNNRTKGKSQMHLAIEDLQELEHEFEDDFTLFFKDLVAFTNLKLEKCDRNKLQNFEWSNKNEIRLISNRKLCLTVGQEQSKKGGGGTPVHLMRNLSLELCNKSLNSYQAWSVRK
mgnify:CR=1 FL=1